MNIDISQSDKALVIGHFKSGKTTLAHYLHQRYPRALSFDPGWEMGAGHHDIRQVEAEFRRTGRAVFQPKDAAGSFEAFLNLALAQRNAMVTIDEGHMVLDARESPPKQFNALYRLGHKRGLGTTLVTHRFSGDLPTVTRSVSHAFVFRIRVDRDIEQVRAVMGDEAAAFVADPPEHHFWYWGPRSSGPCQPVPIGQDNK